MTTTTGPSGSSRVGVTKPRTPTRSRGAQDRYGAVRDGAKFKCFNCCGFGHLQRAPVPVQSEHEPEVREAMGGEPLQFIVKRQHCGIMEHRGLEPYLLFGGFFY